MGLLVEEVKSHFKLDFIDKILISIVFIIGAILCPFYCFADEGYQPIEYQDVLDLYFSNVTAGNNSTIIERSGSTLKYIELEKGYLYRYRVVVDDTSPSYRVVAYGNSIPSVDLPVYIASRVEAGNYFYINPDDINYSYLYVAPGAHVIFERMRLTGQDAAIGNLSFIVGFNSIWSTFNFLIPYIGVVVLCVIGLLFIKRLIMSLSKGKARI